MPPERAPADPLRRVRDRVEEALERAGLTPSPGGPPAPLVVAVSGGPDSLALLHALADLREPLGLSLTVAHLDHGLRPTSGEDARFVREQAERLDLPCRVERADVAGYRRARRLSLEQAAREVRYAFLCRVAREVGAQAVALGHTRDDQAETVLLHLVRGSGLPGLRGMSLLSPYRGPDGGETLLFRPLLGTGREETEAFCRARGLSPRWDESNRDRRFSRNLLRWEVMPLLRRLNPGVREALLRLSAAVARDLDYLEGEVEARWPEVVQATAGGLFLDKGAFGALHPALQRHLLRRAYASLVAGGEGLAQAHLEAMMDLLGGPAGRTLALPGGVRLWAEHTWALLGRGPGPPCPLPPLEGETPVAVPGETLAGGWRVQARLLPPPFPPLPQDPYEALLDAGAVGGPLTVRTRRPGDRFWPLGMEGEKKLQDFLVDAHIPRAWRDRVPLVVSPRGVAWVVGWRVAHWARLTPSSPSALSLRFTPA